MAEIALLGYGTVGSGVFSVLETNRLSIDKKASEPIRIKYILDLRSFDNEPQLNRLLTKNFEDILNDDDVSVVVEAMGGIEPAYTYVKQALLKGKSCVTSNKELVALYGAELLQIARERNINFLFEASVGGGIPIIRPLNQSLTADEIKEIRGILNGTTNYILTKMSSESKSFETALKEAQEKGYAERNPEADVCGYDSCRKIAILLSLALGKHVDYKEIYTEGITSITKSDISYAKAIGCVIKLIATAKIEDKDAVAYVCPTLIKNSNPLSVVDDVFNAIFVKGNVIDEVMFYGRGAGKLPTASAVVADIVDAVKHRNVNIMHFWAAEKHQIIPMEDVLVSKLVRVSYENEQSCKEQIASCFGDVQLIKLIDGELGFITPKIKQNDLKDKLLTIEQKGFKILSSILIDA